MKAKLTLIALMIVGLIGTQVFATESKKAAETSASVAKVDILADGQRIQVRGVMEKTRSGLFLLDGKGTFLLKGDNGLEKLVGQPVEVQGVFKKGEKNGIILVHRAKVVD